MIDIKDLTIEKAGEMMRNGELTSVNLVSACLKNIEEKIDVYFYDGDHSFDAQRDALTYYVSAMNDVFIYLVDDWNDEPKVVRGTYAGIGLKENKLRLHKEWIFKTPGNCFPVWWNGFYVAVLEKL